MFCLLLAQPGRLTNVQLATADFTGNNIIFSHDSNLFVSNNEYLVTGQLTLDSLHLFDNMSYFLSENPDQFQVCIVKYHRHVRYHKIIKI